MLLETHSGIFLAALIFAAMVLIASFSLAGKLALKHIPAAIILSGSAIFWLISSLGSCIVVGKGISIHKIDLFPFSTVFKTIEDFQGFQSTEEFLTYYLLPQLIILGITLVFGIVWGITAPILFKTNGLRKFVVLSLCTLFPVELMVNLCYIFQISYENYYDTAAYLLLAIGASIGWLIFKAFFKRNKYTEEKK